MKKKRSKTIDLGPLKTVEDCQNALRIWHWTLARKQGAKPFEVRSATEGLDTPVLQDAKALLDELM